MATLHPDIKTKNWQISSVGVGYIAEGLADIRQCLDLLLRTQKGSDPLRPDFGCDVFQYVDKPLTYAIPNIIRNIIESIEIWEKRVTLHKVTYEIEESHVKFFVTCRLVDEELIDLILYYLNGGFVIPPSDTGSLTLFALFPPNPNDKRYNISFTANGNTVLPQPPANGFATINQLYSWVIANWGGYGSWQLGADRITLFIPSGPIQSGSLTMLLVGALRFEAPAPFLAVGQDYQLTFIPDGVPPALTPPTFDSIGALLSWVQANWASYGSWTIEGNPVGVGDFNIDDFDSEDFDTGIAATYVLVLTSETVNSCVLEISPV